MGHSRRWAWVCADSRGAGLVEYILAIGLVAIIAIAGFRAFGASALAKTEQHAQCVQSLDCGEGNPQGTLGTQGAAVTGNGPQGKPDYDTIDGGKDATYQHIPGQPTITGQGDGTAVHPNDVSQGQIGDCYLMAGMAAIATRNPGLIENAVHDNGDGTYTVTFYEKAPFWKFWDSGYHPVQITVNGDFPANKDGNPVFAQPGDRNGDQRELWPMIVEKAYAQWKGGYNEIGHGGMPGDVMTALTGQDSSRHGSMSMEDLATAWENGDAITMWTPGDGDKKPLFANDTLVGNHAYFVTNVNREAGTITVHNPWGWNTGDIVVTYEQYRQHFSGTSTNRID